MKKNLYRALIPGLYLVCAVAMIAHFGAIGTIALLVHPCPNVMLGVTSYPVINATTVSDLEALTPKAREELWIKRILLGADRVQSNPFSDNFIGGPGSGKPVITVTDTEKVAGNTINIPTVGGFGGPGVAGEGDRIGNEQKIIIGNFPVKIGRYWFGVGFTSVAKSETVVGGRIDQIINDGLRDQMAKRRSDDVMMRMKLALTTATGARNLVFPDGVSSIAELKTANVVSTGLISKGSSILSGLGGQPMKVGTQENGSMIEQFMFFGTNNALSPLDSEPAYLDARIKADVRGPGNSIFRGVYNDWLGTGIYRWYQRDHANYGSVGSPLMARAFLGAALTGATTGTIVKGGGSAAAAAATPKPQFFEFFSNAPYPFMNGDVIAADVATTRYLQIINPDGTYGTYSYVLNDGNQITISAAALAVGDVAKRTTNHPIGALITEVNVIGTAFGYSLELGQEAVLCGTGSIDGKKVDAQMGKRTEEHRNHDMDHAIGVETVWGCAPVQRVDNVYPNFVVAAHAVPVPGAPVIT